MPRTLACRQLRYALRQMRRTPGFTTSALATLALALGATLTIFAAVDAILLRPLPFPAAHRLVTIFNTYPRAGVDRDGASLANYYERRGRVAAFEDIALYASGAVTIGEAGSAERDTIMRVSPGFFATLGVGLAMGRGFGDEDTTPQTDAVVVLTDEYWRQHLHADPLALGRHLRVNGTPHRVVGILPDGFRFLSSSARVYLPLSSTAEARMPAQRHSGGNVVQMIARLRPGVAVAEAQSQIDVHNAAVEADTPSPDAARMADAGFRSVVAPLHGDHVAAIRPTLLLMQAGVLLLLLIGAVNVVNLLLVRASGRLKELAVRQAIGASRRHIVNDVMTEIVLLTFVGGLLGVAVAAGGIRLLAVLGAGQLPLGAHIVFDTRVALVALAGAIATGMAIGVPIVIYSLRAHAAGALVSESRGGTTGRAAQRLRHGFLVAQISLAFVLLVGAGLLVVSVARLAAVSPGFRPDHVLIGRVSLPPTDYPNSQARLAFTGRLVEELGRQPGVVTAGVVTNVPLSGLSGKSASVVQGHAPGQGESPQGHYAYSVDGDYFAAMGFTLLEGRFLDGADSRRAARAAVVDDAFARRYWPEGSAIGGRVFRGSGDHDEADAFTVVGVVGAAKQAGLTERAGQGAVYYPLRDRSDADLFVVTRTSVPPDVLGSTLRSAVLAIDPELPINDVRSMETRIYDNLVERRSPAVLAALFAALAVLLTAIGTYGVLSHAVALRRREIGLRLALGATPGQVRGGFVALALRLLAGGALVGGLGAWLTGRAMQALLFDVPPLHPGTLAAAAGIVTVSCVVACLIPARRAARMSPMAALADS